MSSDPGLTAAVYGLTFFLMMNIFQSFFEEGVGVGIQFALSLPEA